MFKVLHLDVLDGVVVWDMGTYHGVHWPITNFSRSQNGSVFEKQNKDVVLQPIKIMGTIEILDQSTTLASLVDLIDEMFTSIRNTTMEFPTLQLHLLSSLKVLQSKQQDLLTRGIVGIEHLDSTSLFPITDCDNSLKRQRIARKSYS